MKFIFIENNNYKNRAKSFLMKKCHYFLQSNDKNSSAA